MDFTEFDKKIDAAQLKKDISEAAKNQDFPEVPNGTYTCKMDKLEVGTTKDGRPMLKAQLRIVGDEDGNKSDYNKQCLFMNRVLFGTKNDANMIASAVGWLKSLEPSIDVEFKGYQDFAGLVMDIEEDIDGLQYVVDYNKDAFNSISIEEAFEAE